MSLLNSAKEFTRTCTVDHFWIQPCKTANSSRTAVCMLLASPQMSVRSVPINVAQIALVLTSAHGSTLAAIAHQEPSRIEDWPRDSVRELPCAGMSERLGESHDSGSGADQPAQKLPAVDELRRVPSVEYAVRSVPVGKAKLKTTPVEAVI